MGLSRFSAAAEEAAADRVYDVEVGVCLSNDPTRVDNNQPLIAPLPCADAVFNVSGDVEEGRTSREVTGLTPGRAYSFRIVTRVTTREERDSQAATDAGAISALAVATASGAEAEGGGDVSPSSSPPSSSSSSSSSFDFDFDFDAAVVDTTPGLAFCGARRDAFPNGTLLLDGASVLVDTPAACCLACSRAMVGGGTFFLLFFFLFHFFFFFPRLVCVE